MRSVPQMPRSLVGKSKLGFEKALFILFMQGNFNEIVEIKMIFGDVIDGFEKVFDNMAPVRIYGLKQNPDKTLN